MRRKGIYAAALILVLALGGCGQKQTADHTENAAEAEQDATQSGENNGKDTTADVQDGSQSEGQNIAGTGDSQEMPTAEQGGAQDTASDGEENFSVDSETVTAFAQKVQLLVASEDLEGLADVTAYPVYVGFAEDGQVIESKEDLLALGADKIFTPELKTMIAGVDAKTLSASMAGFVMSDDSGKPNITFSMTDGALKIVGINY